MSPRKTRSSTSQKARSGSETNTKAPQPNGIRCKNAVKPRAEQSRPFNKEASASKRQQRRKDGVRVRNGSCAAPAVKLENGLECGDSAPPMVGAIMKPDPNVAKGLKRLESPVEDIDAQSPKKQGTAGTKAAKVKSPKKSPVKNLKFVGAHVSASGEWHWQTFHMS